MRDRSVWLIVPMMLGLVGSVPTGASAQDEAPAALDEEVRNLLKDRPQPLDVPQFELPALPTVPVRRGLPGPNWTMVDTATLPRDPEGIWILEFAFKPVRMIEVEIPGKGRKRVHYMYYRVVNRTGQPRRFVPQFTLVTDTGQRIEDTVLPLAVKLIQAKEDPTMPLLGAVETTGTLPASEKDGIDDAVYGVAIWGDVDYKADAFSVYVRGLSDAMQVVESPNGEKTDRYKALRIDFARPGDERSPHSREIQLRDPAYEWVYFP